MVSYPKSQQVKKAPKKAKKRHGICPRCGNMWRGEVLHISGCPQDMPVKSYNKSRTGRQMICDALDVMYREFTTWRDGCICVLGEVDGAHCGGESQWGHVIPQGQSGFLVYNMSNSFRQCRNHNQEHTRVQLTYFQWYRRKFGNTAMDMLDNIWRGYSGTGHHFSTSDLLEMLVDINRLWDNRFSYGSATIEQKVRDGLYGEIIKAAWIKDGRI